MVHRDQSFEKKKVRAITSSMAQIQAGERHIS